MKFVSGCRRLLFENWNIVGQTGALYVFQKLRQKTARSAIITSDWILNFKLSTVNEVKEIYWIFKIKNLEN